MKYFRMLLCKLFGHRSICLFRKLYNPETKSSSYTDWKCERCGKTFIEGWDE